MNFKRYLLMRLSMQCRRKSDWLVSAVFLVLCAVIFPFGLNVSENALQRLAPGILWTCGLIASLLPVQASFKEDLDDGSLELEIAQGVSWLDYCSAKFLTIWLFNLVTLLACGIVVLTLYGVPAYSWFAILGSLAAGSVALSCLGCMGACLSTTNSGIASLIVLPLAVPVLIFGAHTGTDALAHYEFRAEFLWDAPFEILLSLACLYIPLSVLVSIYALKTHLEES